MLHLLMPTFCCPGICRKRQGCCTLTVILGTEDLIVHQMVQSGRMQQLLCGGVDFGLEILFIDILAHIILHVRVAGKYDVAIVNRQAVNLNSNLARFTLEGRFSR